MIYEPQEDSYMLEEQVKKLVKNVKVLDMGTGSGIQARAALENNCEVLAIDINQEAVDYVKKKGIRVIKSDLFSNVEGKFDVIIFNPPYLPEEELEDEESKLCTTGGKKGSEIVERFLKEVKHYLNENGFILVVVSSLTGKDLFEGFKFEVLSEKSFFFEKLYAYRLFVE